MSSEREQKEKQYVLSLFLKFIKKILCLRGVRGQVIIFMATFLFIELIDSLKDSINQIKVSNQFHSIKV